jgi:uncharacterized protein YpmS
MNNNKIWQVTASVIFNIRDEIEYNAGTSAQELLETITSYLNDYNIDVDFDYKINNLKEVNNG